MEIPVAYVYPVLFVAGALFAWMLIKYFEEKGINLEDDD